MEYQYEFRSDAERHECVSWTENEAVIFSCKQCDFVRKIDLRTGKLSIVKMGNQEALHGGSHHPIGPADIVGGQN